MYNPQALSSATDLAIDSISFVTGDILSMVAPSIASDYIRRPGRSGCKFRLESLTISYIDNTADGRGEYSAWFY